MPTNPTPTQQETLETSFICKCCQRQMELRIDGKFCNECYHSRRAAVAGPRGDVVLLQRLIDELAHAVEQGYQPNLLDIAEARQLLLTATPSIFDAIQIVENCEYENVAVDVILQRLKALLPPPATPAERTRVAEDQDERDPLADMMMPIIYKAATEPCRNYARGCPENQPDQSCWCAPCEAREAKETIEDDPEIVSRYCLTAPADNDGESK